MTHDHTHEVPKNSDNPNSEATLLRFEQDGMTYWASPTGFIYRTNSTEPNFTDMVLSFVNGSMCVNYLDKPIDCANFDQYALEIFFCSPDLSLDLERLAYFDPATNSYKASPA